MAGSLSLLLLAKGKPELYFNNDFFRPGVTMFKRVCH
jgi:hypothetical protein